MEINLSELWHEPPVRASIKMAWLVMYGPQVNLEDKRRNFPLIGTSLFWSYSIRGFNRMRRGLPWPGWDEVDAD